MGGRGKPPEPTSTRTDPPTPTAPEAPEDNGPSTPSQGRTPAPFRDDGYNTPPEPDYEAQPDLLTLMPAHLRRGGEMAARAYLSARQKASARWGDWARAVAAMRVAGVPEDAITLLAAQAGVPMPEPPAAGGNGRALG